MRFYLVMGGTTMLLLNMTRQVRPMEVFFVALSTFECFTLEMTPIVMLKIETIAMKETAMS